MILFCFEKKPMEDKNRNGRLLYLLCFWSEPFSEGKYTYKTPSSGVYSEKSFHKLKAPRWPALSSEARPSSEHDPEPLSCSLQSVPLPTLKGKQNPNI